MRKAAARSHARGRRRGVSSNVRRRVGGACGGDTQGFGIALCPVVRDRAQKRAAVYPRPASVCGSGAGRPWPIFPGNKQTNKRGKAISRSVINSSGMNFSFYQDVTIPTVLRKTFFFSGVHKANIMSPSSPQMCVGIESTVVWV